VKKVGDLGPFVNMYTFHKNSKMAIMAIEKLVYMNGE